MMEPLALAADRASVYSLDSPLFSAPDSRPTTAPLAMRSKKPHCKKPHLAEFSTSPIRNCSARRRASSSSRTGRRASRPNFVSRLVKRLDDAVEGSE
jgi:hypothetical protein